MLIVSKDFIICVFDAIDFNVACIKSFVCILSSSSMIEAFLFILNLSFHDSTDSHNISRDASINLIISKFTINCLWHFSSIHIFDIVIDFLESNSLKETCLCSMLLSNKESWMTLSLNTFTWLSPFTINKVDWHFLFTIIAFKHNTFDKNFNWTNSQNSSSNTNEFVYQMTLDNTESKLLIVVVKLRNYIFSCFDHHFEKSNWVQS